MFRSSLLVTVFALFTQGIGFIKLLLVAQYFGVSVELDAYYLSLVIPTLLLGFVVGALQTGFMPVYGSFIAHGDYEKAKSFRSAVLWLIVVISITFCFLLSQVSPYLMELLIAEGTPEVKKHATDIFQIVVYILALNATADYFALILNTHKQFLFAASAPLFNVVVSTVFLFMFQNIGALALVYGLLLGLIVQTAIVLVVLVRNNLGFQFRCLFLTPELHRAWQLTLPILVGVALTNANFSIDQVMANMAGEGAVSILGYASRFHNVVTQAGIIGISTVLLPTLIRLVAQGALSEAFHLMYKLFIIVFFVSAFVVLLIFSVGDDILTKLVVRGSFTHDNALQVFEVWGYYTLGLFPMACGIFYAKLYQALQLPGLITRLAIVSFVLNIGLNWVLVNLFGVSGIAMATSLVYTIVTFLFYVISKKRWKDA